MPDCEISFDLARIDFRATSDLLMASYWGAGRSDEFIAGPSPIRSARPPTSMASRSVSAGQSPTARCSPISPTSSSGRRIAGRASASGWCRHSSIIPSSVTSRTGACRPVMRMGSTKSWASRHRPTVDTCAWTACPSDRRAANGFCHRCCKIIAVVGPDMLLGRARLGDASERLYKDHSAIHLREVRMAVFKMVMRGREA